MFPTRGTCFEICAKSRPPELAADWSTTLALHRKRENPPVSAARAIAVTQASRITEDETVDD